MRPPWKDRGGRISPLRCAGLLLTAAPAAWMLYDWRSGGFGPLPLIGLVYWSGVWTTFMLLLALAVSPARTLLRWNALIDVRRMIGVAALVYALVHTLSFFALYRWDWSGILGQTFGRASLIVATASLAGFAILGATSTDAAVRRLGGQGWRRLHRLNYALTGLAVAHFLLSPGIFNLQYVTLGLLLWLLCWRLVFRSGAEPRPASLALLAGAVSLAVLGAEVAWMWAYQDVPPAESIAEIFSFEEEWAPPLQVLGFGLAVALLASLPLGRAKASSR